MNLDVWQTFVKSFRFGKVLPGATYVARCSQWPGNNLFAKEISRAAEASKPSKDWNLLKLHHSERALTFLYYPGFDEDPHPSLLQATKINLASGRIVRIDYSKRANPPILHRKESFLSKEDPRFQRFHELTVQEENAGLLQDTRKIGTKLGWEALLRQKGFCFEGHRLVAESPPLVSHAAVLEASERHRTAIFRKDLSRPVKLLIKHGLLREGRDFFDFGCGRGMDVQALRQLGYEANGWDPAFQPDAPLKRAEIVNLGYVLNVIEDPSDRKDALTSAAALADRVLIVSTLVAGQQTKAHQNSFGDGFLTRRGTFQKFYEPSELEGMIERTLEIEPITLAPGVCLVFSRREDHESFSASRTQRVVGWSEIGAQLRCARPIERKQSRVSRYSLNRKLFDRLWQTMLAFGRIPETDEFEDWPQVRRAAGSRQKGVDLVLARKGEDLFSEARRMRCEDVLVYLAMTRFRRRFRRKDLSPKILRDIKAFWGGYDGAQAEADSLLFALGDPGELELALESVGFGYRDPVERHFTFHRSKLDLLPVVLRIYVLCGQWIYGDLSEVDLIKIHLHSGKLSLLIYDNFDGKDAPVLQTRVKMVLRNQWIRIFDHSGDSQILETKEFFV